MKIIFALILSLSILLLLSDGCKQKTKEVVKVKPLNLKTIENLKASIVSEQISANFYIACAVKAREENYMLVAELLETISKSDSVHMCNLKELLFKYNDSVIVPASSLNIKTTSENIQEALKNEGEVIDNILPDYIKTAKEEKIQDAKKMFNWMMITEMKHHKLLKNALNNLAKNKAKKISKTYYVCPKCGNIFYSKFPTKCEVCKTTSDKFIIFK
jgi:rubrerythrin